MHAGQIKTIFDILSFYRRSEIEELEHQELSNAELSQIEAFLKTLSGPLSFPQ
jgi:cytochrome c peroxidase